MEFSLSRPDVKQSPYNRSILQTMGIDDIYHALYQRDNIFLIVADNDDYKNLLIRFIFEHYRQRVVFEEYQSFDHLEAGLKIFRVREAFPSSLRKNQVRRCILIPRWLDDLGQNQNIDYSKVFEAALRESLSIKVKSAE